MPDQPIHVLLVEDNPTDTLLVQEAFAHIPAVSLTLSHVERISDALQYQKQASCDVVLLDLGLPDSQGLETAVSQ